MKSNQRKGRRIKPREVVGVWQCLDCYRSERRETRVGRLRNKQSTLRVLQRRCWSVRCPCNAKYFADGKFVEATP